MMKRNSPCRELTVIEEMIEPLNAPVKQFENRIRTSPLHTLVSVLLSSRTKDAVTLAASERLFSGVMDSLTLAALSVEEIESRIYPVGFFRQKARHIKQIAEQLKSGTVLTPDRDMLMSLPGVGRKTANLVLALAFGVPAIAVDIHVFRISRRLGWCHRNTTAEVEQELMALFKQPEMWPRLNQTLVAFGQTICRPLRPLCRECSLSPVCPAAVVSDAG